ncbi:hypothetical protein JVT61DRAFT_8530 [Boletus reticuloceps]|uniref:CxC5 like cysteine cluster associated with KDZ domain-containing protein n=1 Tax=Boletus reticuloceps TaxID=495285 RepID=A0A8I2Z185_9AGAM|nr:hypothetical protein JVT61DRAFT_8530 [Boletus reticuloceps]
MDSNISLGTLFAALQPHPNLFSMPLNVLTCFICCASLLKDDILQLQSYKVPINVAPTFLPSTITSFLTDCFDLSSEDVDSLWNMVKEAVWMQLSMESEKAMCTGLFQQYGTHQGITLLTLYPPFKACQNPSCPMDHRSQLLEKEESCHVVIFTYGDGAQPVWSIHLKCRHCHTNYHNNFSVNGLTRTYYGGVPQYIQVGEHQFAEEKLILHWIDLMLNAYGPF